MRDTDRSRTELDHWCPMARYWGYEFEGIGLAPMEQPEPLRFGGSIASQLANIKQNKPWNVKEFLGGNESLLAEALLYGYERIVWPRWLKDFELVSIETEYPKLLADWLRHNARPDTIMRRKSDQTLWYGPEDKTTGWTDSLFNYTNNIQLHATALCVEEIIGEQISGAMVQGLYKGFTKEGQFYHPLVYAYYKEGIPGVVPDQWKAKYTRGFQRNSTDNFPGGVRGWVDHLLKTDPDVFLGIFPNTPPVMIRRDLAKEHLAQVLQRESQLQPWREAGRPKDQIPLLFPKYFGQCDEFGKSRNPCTFKQLCYSPTAQRFPLSVYKYREPHHEGEKENLDAESRRLQGAQ